MLPQRLARSLQIASRQCCPATRSAVAPFAVARSLVAPVVSHQQPALRWYSSEKISDDANNESNKEQAELQGAQDKANLDGAQQESPAQKELEAKKKELVEMTDRYKRSVAEYRNLQEQTKREVQAAKNFALQSFAKELLDSVDNLDRALTTVPKEKLNSDNQDLVNLHSGLKMTEEIFLKTLAKNGLERFDPSVNNEAFDPNKHEATFQTPQPDKKDGSVFFTQSKGFIYNGRVLRAAKVGVVKNS